MEVLGVGVGLFYAWRDGTQGGHGEGAEEGGGELWERSTHGVGVKCFCWPPGPPKVDIADGDLVGCFME